MTGDRAIADILVGLLKGAPVAEPTPMTTTPEAMREAAARLIEHAEPGWRRWINRATILSAIRAIPVAEPPFGLLDPDMPTADLLLHMGEMTAQEVRTARAAIRWANSRAIPVAAAPDLCRTIEAQAEEIARLREALTDTAAVAADLAQARGLPDTAEFLVGGAYRWTLGEILDAANAALAAITGEPTCSPTAIKAAAKEERHD